MTPEHRSARLRAVPGEPDQVPRLLRFREVHPQITITFGPGPFWQALLPEPNGETVVTRYDLKALLDKLGEILPPESNGPP